MSNRVGDYVKAERERRGLTLGGLARLAGYRNIGKGARRIQGLEREGVIPPEAFDRIATALGLDPAKVEELAEADHRDFIADWERWADEPTPVEIILRAVPGFYLTQIPPPHPEWSREQWEAHAGAIAREKNVKVCLVLSRRHKSWIGQDGTVGRRAVCGPDDAGAPFMRLRGRGARGVRFTLG